MLASINPLGERSRNSRWGVTFTAYLVGSVAGGATIGVLFGFAGRVWDATPLRPGPAVVAVVVVACCIAGVALDAGVGGLRLPSVRRQVNEDWLVEYRGWVYGLGFGYQLGLGVVTIVSSASVYVALALALLTRSVTGGLLVGATFGLVRALPLLAVARVREASALRHRLRRAQAIDRPARRAGAAVLVAASVAAVGALAAQGAAWAS
jgi:hypothetical protein